MTNCEKSPFRMSIINQNAVEGSEGRLIDFNRELVGINQKLTRSLNQNLIFIVKFKSDQFQCSNLYGLESESSTIQFVGFNCLSFL